MMDVKVTSETSCLLFKDERVDNVQRKIRKRKHLQLYLCSAVYVTLFDATCFGFFYRAIFRVYELLKECVS